MSSGRKSKYETEVLFNLDKILDMASNGFTDKQIYNSIGISYNTFYNYLKDPSKSELNDTIKKGRLLAHQEIENALFKNARGHTYKEQSAIKIKDVHWEDGKKIETEEIKIIELEKYIPPQTASIIFYLKNKLPETYKDNPFTEKDIEDIALIRNLIKDKSNVDINKNG